MRSNMARVLIMVAGALLAGCGATTNATIADPTTSSIAVTTSSTTTTVGIDEGELTAFAGEVVSTVNAMQDAWDGQLAASNQQLFDTYGSARLSAEESHSVEAEHLATMRGILGSAGEQLPMSAPVGATFSDTYSAFWDAHDSLTGWFGQLSDELGVNVSSYAENPDEYQSSIAHPLAEALDRYLAACFGLQAELLKWSETLIECGPQPPELGPNGFMLFTGEDAKMRRAGHYENSDFFRTITFVSDGNWICNNECTHGHEEFGDAFEAKFTEVPGAFLIIADGGDMTAIEHVKRFAADKELTVGEPTPFDPSEKADWVEGLVLAIKPSPQAGYSFRCGASSLPCATTDLGREITEWVVSFDQTIWILTRSTGRTVIANAHFSPGYEPPEEHREVLLESATPLVASLGFPD